jgi:hypothetical protein
MEQGARLRRADGARDLIPARQDEASEAPVQEKKWAGTVAVLVNIFYIMYDGGSTHSPVRKPGKIC